MTAKSTTMTVKTRTPAQPRGLAALREVKLDKRHQRILDYARATCGGPLSWQQRKLAEVQDLLALAQISTRLTIEWLDAVTELRVLLEMRVPVPCLPRQDGPLAVAPRALLGILCRQELLLSPPAWALHAERQPGFSFVQILRPHGSVWHPNIDQKHQVLCLGNLAVGLPLKEGILLTYGALTMSTVQLDAMDPAGVMNATPT
jgi:hypothetical protein